MITSYLGSGCIGFPVEFIPHDDVPRLLDLVGLSLPARKWLQIQDFRDALLGEDVMVAGGSVR
jgi:hypothetical protein